MPIYLLIGDDAYAIGQRIQAYASQLDPAWKTLSYHRFEVSGFKPDALTRYLQTEIAPIARTLPLSTGNQLVVIESCSLSGLPLEALEWLEHLPASTILILTSPTLDRRLKITKWLLKFAKVQEFQKLNPWQTEAIAEVIANQAETAELDLSRKSALYLAEAIGNDTARIASELQKLQLYSQGAPLSLKTIQSLVPSHTHSALQLAEAVRTGNRERIIELLHALENTHPSILVATLITQFRTWLWVKATVSDRTSRRSDTEIAQLCGIGNPKRLYFLKQDVAKLSAPTLVRTLSRLHQLSFALKQGPSNDVLPELVEIATMHYSKLRSSA